jgi:hypothetical protein
MWALCGFAAALSWAPVTGDFQHFRYGNGQAIENSAGHLPASYHFLGGPAPTRTVCPLENRSSVYWFTPDGAPLDRTFVTPNPSEFDVSAKQTMKGFAASASFGGYAKNAGAIEVVYFTDRVCSDAGVEYGFSRDLATNSILVYWSTYANCGNDAASLCRQTNNPALGDRFSNVRQENGGIASDHGFRIYGLDVNARYTYRMSVEGRAFRVEVMRERELAQCSDSESGPRGACTFLKPVQPWFPIDQLGAGYIVAGTQNSGGSEIAGALEVSDILVAK